MIAIRMMASQRLFSYTLGNWIQHSHNIEMWSYDKNNDTVIAYTNDTFWIFERTNLTTSRKGGTFIYTKKQNEYASKRKPTKVDWQECQPNFVFV